MADAVVLPRLECVVDTTRQQSLASRLKYAVARATKSPEDASAWEQVLREVQTATQTQLQRQQARANFEVAGETDADDDAGTEANVAATQDVRREAMEACVSAYPTCAKFWRAYVDSEILLQNHDYTRSIFSRSLLQIPNVELWRSYVSFVVATSDPETNQGAREIEGSYEFG